MPTGNAVLSGLFPAGNPVWPGNAGGVSAGQAAGGPMAPGASSGGGFANLLGQAIDALNQLNNQADTAAAMYAAGAPVSLDQVMVAEQEASLAVDLAVQVRDRAINAYQSIMNMQI